MLCSEFVPEDKRERSTRVGSFMKTLRILPLNGARANQLSLCTAPTAGTPKSLLPAPHPARPSREKTRNQPAQHRHVGETSHTGKRSMTWRNKTLRGLPRGTSVIPSANGEKSGGGSGKSAGAQRTHHCGAGRMRFLFLMSYGLSLSERDAIHPDEYRSPASKLTWK